MEELKFEKFSGKQKKGNFEFESRLLIMIHESFMNLKIKTFGWLEIGLEQDCLVLLLFFKALFG